MPISNDSRAIYVALSHDLSIGPKTLRQMLNQYDSIESVWRKSSDPRVVKLRSQYNANELFESIVSRDINVITWADDVYPAILNELPDPPYILYLKGQLDQNFWGLAVVGARKSTAYGRQVAYDLTHQLAKLSIPIISGLALGIDSVAHRACLEASGQTVAVLAGGLDRIYPTIHTSLANQIASQGGAVISEYPPGVPALPHHFPVRNRLIAGLAKGVIIIEAKIKSGSLLTAQSAVEYNREVFVVPHSIYSESGQGPLNLLKMGAKLITDVTDILEGLNLPLDKTADNLSDPPINLRPTEQLVFKALGSEAASVDELAEKVQLPFSKLSATITLMEMKGLIVNLGGNIYTKKH